MNEIRFAAPEIAASRQRGIPADEGELWETLHLDAERAAAGEEMLRSFLDPAVLRHDGFASGLALLLARKLAEYSMPAERLGEIGRAAMANDPGIIAAAIADLVAIRTRDPAAENYLRPFLYYKGFHALQWHRIGHWLWQERGDRHPKVRDGVLLCAGAKVLGNVEIGRDAKVGAGSVVLHDVPPRATVAGVPARIVGWSSGSVPALEMDQSLPDYEI
jgi:serine O-acetyltransferase